MSYSTRRLCEASHARRRQAYESRERQLTAPMLQPNAKQQRAKQHEIDGAKDDACRCQLRLTRSTQQVPERRTVQPQQRKSDRQPPAFRWLPPGQCGWRSLSPHPEQPMPRDVRTHAGTRDAECDGQPQLQRVVQRDSTAGVRYR